MNAPMRLVQSDLKNCVNKKYGEIEKNLLQNANKLLKIYEKTFPPYNPQKIATLRHIEIVEKEIKEDGLLIPVDGGFKLILNKGCRGRVNFTCAHEIAHTFFYDFTSNKPKKLNFPYISNKEEENLCDKMASRLLMPTKMLENNLSMLKFFDCNNLFGLANRYRVSIEAMAMRIGEIDHWKNMMIIGWNFMGRDKPFLMPKLRLDWWYPKIIMLPRYKSSDEIQIVNKAYDSKKQEDNNYYPIEFKTISRLGQLKKGEYRIIAKKYGSKIGGRVVSIFFLNKIK